MPLSLQLHPGTSTVALVAAAAENDIQRINITTSSADAKTCQVTTRCHVTINISLPIEIFSPMGSIGNGRKMSS